MSLLELNRRTFLTSASGLLGATALGSLEKGVISGAEQHFPAEVKHVIYLFMSGGPSQMDLFDYKSELEKRSGKDLPYKLPDTEATVGLDKN